MIAGPRAVRLLLVLLAILLAAPSMAGADLVFAPQNTTMAVLDAAGHPDNRAGAHPDRLVQSFEFEDTGGAPEHAKDMVIELPPGFAGDLSGTPFCPRAMIADYSGECPLESQVGSLSGSPLFNIEPGPDEAASFAIKTFLGPVRAIGRLRPTDQGLSLHLSNIKYSYFSQLDEGTIELWGVPADHQEGTSIPRRPFLTTPTRCDSTPLAVTMRMRTWERQDRWTAITVDSGQPQVGCGELRFGPQLGFSLDSPVADAPTGVRIELTSPANEDPDGLATAQLRDASIVLPQGMTLSPGAAERLRSCSDAQLGLGTAAAPSCPASSRVGTAELVVGSLSKPVTGRVYLGQEQSGDRFRLFIAASAPGSEIKFVASLRTNAATGRLTTQLSDLPQVPLERMTLRFTGGRDALLATPLACGPAPASAEFTPYSGGPTAAWAGAVAVTGIAGAPCAGPAPFAPSFSGGSTNARAGRATAFTATVRRQDGEQLPARLSIALPAGVSAALGTVRTCPAAAAARAACPAASRVGTALGELGPGTSPARIGGDIYLTGPYRRAPFGIAIGFKAALGPFDLGTFVVRGAIRVDPLSGRVTVETDPLPTSFEGLPIRFQTLALDLDRPGFMRNPTSCAPTRVAATLRAASGALARPSTPFLLRGCIDLPFRPAFSMALTDRGELHRDGKPGLRISARVPAGDANLRMVEIAFPKLLKFGAALRQICARREATEGNCPKGSRVGTAAARSPLLDAPMRGSIYAVQPRGTGSPDLWTRLAGSGLEVSLKSETTAKDGRAVTRLVDLPDFPLATLRMKFASGEQGMLKLEGDPCASRGGLVAPMRIAGQNEARTEIRAGVAVPANCGRER